MSAPRSLSVLIPTWQGGELFERCLAALARQRLALPWDVLVIDSSSSDGTWERLGSWAERFPVPLARRRIHPLEFDHGDTRNLLAALSRGELLVFLTQDALAVGEDFLARLAAAFDDPRVGAAYARNVPRPDAALATRIGSDEDPGYAAESRALRIDDPAAYAALDAHQRRLLYNFNDVASAIRRSLWERHPFPRTAFGEDVLMARALLEAGHTVVYQADAQVEHSHDYDAAQTWKRAEIDGRFSVEWLERTCVASLADARVLTERRLERDREALARAGLAGAELAAELERLRPLRAAAFEGLWAGGRSTRRHARTRLLESPTLSILYVVHGFPPETWAGTEVYTLNLAREMARRGHRVTVLARTGRVAPPDEGGPADFALLEDRFEELRVLRLVNRLRPPRLSASWKEPRAEAAFRRVLADVRPDVVHFQHLIHGSIGCVEIAREAGAATLITCHDYWSVCPRVQLVRPDGTRCAHGMGAGCFPCIKDQGLGQVERLEALGRRAGPLLEELARESARSELVPAGLRRSAEGFADLLRREREVVGAYAAADLRISPSRFLRALLIESAGFEPESFVFSDNGMRTELVRALAKRPDPQGRVRFGFVGSLVWYKGGAVAVRAMQRLAGTRAVLYVHGDFRPDEDTHHAELERLAAAVEPRNVFFRGRFDNARLSEVYAELDVLVVPSTWWENSPITIHEAQLARTPVVASGIGGMAEYVRDGVDGLHFQVGDEADLARVLRRFLDEPDLLARLSRDFPPVKSIEENAAECEFRYRGLVARVRPRSGPRTLLELAARETRRRSGPVEEQGAELVLARPGGALEYALEGAGEGARTLLVEQHLYGHEPELSLAARVLVDGREQGLLEPLRARGRDERRVQELALELEPGARVLRLEPAGAGAHLRLARLALREDVRGEAAGAEREGHALEEARR